MSRRFKVSFKSKAQVAAEFMIFSGMAFIFLLVFLSVLADEIDSIAFIKERGNVNDMAFWIQHEVMIAADVKDGYVRDFTLPDKINGFDYTIFNSNQEIVVESSNKGIQQVYLIPPVIGNFTIGDNQIRKQGGVIYVN